MLVRNPKCERVSKLESKWEHTPYRVGKKLIPLTLVYDVVSEDPEPLKKWLHHNLLRLCMLNGDCSAKPAADRRDNDLEDVLQIQEVPLEWYLPLIEPEHLAPADPEVTHI